MKTEGLVLAVGRVLCAHPRSCHMWLWCVLWVGSLYCVQSAGASTQQAPRVALVIGHNKGDAGLKPLRFAQRDALRFFRVLRKLSGGSRLHIKLMLGPTAQQVRKAMAELANRLKGQKPVGTFILYYSGHSYRNYFQLGKSRLAYKEVIRFVRKLPVKVRLMFVDSCFSGQLLQVKGKRNNKRIRSKGIRRSPLKWRPKLLKLKGIAILASSEARGRSYESDTIMSSFFTSGLIAGLRGAADLNKDLRVSFAEIRKYVYESTIIHSLRSGVEVQRPVYKDELQGQGSLFLTYLRKADAWILCSPSLHGHFFLYRNQSLIYEFRKQRGRALQIGLARGIYKLHVRRSDKLGVTIFSLRSKQRFRLFGSAFQWQRRLSPADQKGGDSGPPLRQLGGMLHYAPVSHLAEHGLSASMQFDAFRWLRLGLRYQLGLLNPQDAPYQSHLLGFSLLLGYGFSFNNRVLWGGAYVEPILGLRVSTLAEQKVESEQLVYTDFLLGLGASVGLDVLINQNLFFRIGLRLGTEIGFFQQKTEPRFAFLSGAGLVWKL